MSSAVILSAQPEQILKGLSKLWHSVAELEEYSTVGLTVLRACAMTLIVATDDSDTGFCGIANDYGMPTLEHAGRGIVVTVSPFPRAERQL